MSDGEPFKPKLRVTQFLIPPNCCSGNDHHCAKQFRAQIVIEGSTKQPIVKRCDMPPMNTRGPGVYKHESLKLKLWFDERVGVVCHKLEVRVDTEASYDVTNKVIGLQICRPSMKSEATIVSWDEVKKIACVNIQVRVRLIRQRNHGWEFHDDAGSGSRGKSHYLSRFRFAARLITPDSKVLPSNSALSRPIINSQSFQGVNPVQGENHGLMDDFAICQIPVWSKGNCPARKR